MVRRENWYYADGEPIQTGTTYVPATIAGSFQGEAQAYQASLVGLGVLLVLTIFMIYALLGILYESFIHPLTILSGLPSAGLGALASSVYDPRIMQFALKYTF